LKGECIVWIDGVEKILKKPLTLELLRQEQSVVYASKNLVWATLPILIIKQQNKLRMKSLKNTIPTYLKELKKKNKNL
jgi:hypothetical protein